jgi:hypothetical protein
MRFEAVLLILLVVLIAGAATSRSGGFLRGSPQQPGQKWEDPTTLQARVRKEKAKGIQKVTFPAPHLEYAEEINLKDALAQTKVLVADVIDKNSRLLDSHTIGTFYRLRIVEEVSQPASAGCCDPKDAEFPSDLPPLNDNEIYFVGMGGTLVLEGIEVTVAEDFGELLPFGRYLFFLSPSPSGKFSLGKVGPAGVFRVKSSGHLESIASKSHKLGREIEQTYSNSFVRLKSDVARQRSAPQ